MRITLAAALLLFAGCGGPHRITIDASPAVSLADEPLGVDPNRVWVIGTSRGSEAAQLLGVHFPGLVHGVVAVVPSNVAICATDDRNWTPSRFASAIQVPLDRRHDSYPHKGLTGLDARHYVAWLVPYEPRADQSSAADERVREAVWPKLLAFPGSRT